MPKTIISEGKTTNEAIEKGLKELNVSKNKVNIKILEQEDKRSFFSILAPRVVKVELTLKEDNVNNEINNSNSEITKTGPREARTFSEEELNKAEENANNFLKVFLPKIGNEIQYEIEKEEHGLHISINGENAGFLIGYRGETLYAFQTILSSIVSKGMESRVRIILDIVNLFGKFIKRSYLNIITNMIATAITKTINRKILI